MTCTRQSSFYSLPSALLHPTPTTSSIQTPYGLCLEKKTPWLDLLNKYYSHTFNCKSSSMLGFAFTTINILCLVPLLMNLLLLQGFVKPKSLTPETFSNNKSLANQQVVHTNKENGLNKCQVWSNVFFSPEKNKKWTKNFSWTLQPLRNTLCPILLILIISNFQSSFS